MKIDHTILAWAAACAPIVAKSKVQFKVSILAGLHKDGRWLIRRTLPIIVPLLAGYALVGVVEAASDAPVESPVAHPAPPARLEVYDKTYDLGTLDNPVRVEILEQLKNDPTQAWESYTAAVEAGREVYFQNCVHCHGDHLDGEGMFAPAQNPPPTNFRDADSIVQLSEAYLFWRTTTGGAGLPREAALWNSTMPPADEFLNEEEVWNVILFLYDRVGHVPQMRDPEAAEAARSMRDELQAKREKLKGAELYQFRCAVCHGEEGAGDGPAAEFLYPAPRDFTLGLFKYKTSPASIEQPTDEDLFQTIKNGLPGTGMPAWKSMLDDDQIREVIAVVKGLDTVGIWAPEDAPDEDFDEDTGLYLKTDFIQITEVQSLAGQVPFSEESVAKGKVLFEENCSPCHGDNGRGNPAVEKQLRDDWGQRIWPRNLTKPWTYRVSNVPQNTEETIRKIFTRFSVGIPGSRMPEQSKGIGVEDRWHLANFVFTLRDTTPPVNVSRVIRGVKVDGPLPDSVDDEGWSAAAPTTLPMLPNLGNGERLFRPLNDAVSVRVLYNDEELAFLLEVDDRTYSRPGDPDAEQIQDRSLELHTDAVAIQLPKQDAFAVVPAVEKPLLGHGDAAHATTIWYWNGGSVEPERAPYGMILDAAGGSELPRPRQEDTSLTATGKWVAGRWRVLVKRRRDGGENGDIAFTENAFIPVSFANWDGSNGEVGSKHSLTAWYWLLLGHSDDEPS